MSNISRFIRKMKIVLALLLGTAFIVAAKAAGSEKDKNVVGSYLRITSEIQSRFATTDVEAELTNKNKEAHEVKFSVNLPKEAFITGFSITTNGVTTFGKVQGKEEAKVAYDALVNSGKTGALTAKAEDRDSDVFTTSVNVAAESKVTFNLTYQQVLVRQHGVYKHVIDVNPSQATNQIEIHVLIREQRNITKLHTPIFAQKLGQMTNKDLLNLPEESKNVVVRENGKDYSMVLIQFTPEETSKKGQLLVLYDVDRKARGGEMVMHGGYFYQFFAPEDLPKGTKHMCFVIDRSGSMSGRKMQQVQDAMKVILRQLNEGDRFSIVSFDDEIEVRAPVDATKANIDAAVDFVNTVDARGGTDLHGGIKRGLQVLQNDNTTNERLAKVLVFLTDGEPTSGITGSEQILSSLASANQQSQYSVHGITLGDNADDLLVQSIASDHHGVAKKVFEDSDTDLQLKGFIATISTPLLRDVRIVYENGSVDVGSLVKPADDAVLYEGSEIVVFGKAIEKPEELSAEIQGKQLNAAGLVKRTNRIIRCRPFPRKPPPCFPCLDTPCGNCVTPRFRPEYCCPPPRPAPLSVPAPTPAPVAAPNQLGGFIERMWAYKTVQKSFASARLKRCAPDTCTEVNKKAKDMSLKYGFVTDVTSMVVVPADGGEPLALNLGASGGEKKEDISRRLPSPSPASFSSFGSAGMPFLGGLSGARGRGAGGGSSGFSANRAGLLGPTGNANKFAPSQDLLSRFRGILFPPAPSTSFTRRPQATLAPLFIPDEADFEAEEVAVFTGGKDTDDESNSKVPSCQNKLWVIVHPSISSVSASVINSLVAGVHENMANYVVNVKNSGDEMSALTDSDLFGEFKAAFNATSGTNVSDQVMLSVTGSAQLHTIILTPSGSPKLPSTFGGLLKYVRATAISDHLFVSSDGKPFSSVKRNQLEDITGKASLVQDQIAQNTLKQFIGC